MEKAKVSIFGQSVVQSHGDNKMDLIKIMSIYISTHGCFFHVILVLSNTIMQQRWKKFQSYSGSGHEFFNLWHGNQMKQNFNPQSEETPKKHFVYWQTLL